MRTRFRTLAALLALFAFSVFFAESVWAMTCVDGMGNPSAAVEHGGAHAPESGVHGNDCHTASGSGEDSGPSRSDAPRCPLTAAGAGGSCAVLTLPAESASVDALLPVSAPVIGSADSTHDRLQVSSLFRPPRA